MIREEIEEGWFVKEGNLYRVEDLGGGTYSYLVRAEDSLDWGEGKDFGVGLEVAGVVMGDAGQVQLKRPLENGVLSVGVLDVEALEKEWRNRREGTFLMLGMALAVIAVGAWMMTRGVLQEKKAVQARSQFVASVTHELRAPVGSMRLMADALEGGKLSEEKKGEFHRLIARESGRLSVLIENVMDLARVEKAQTVRGKGYRLE